jgi:transposase
MQITTIGLDIAKNVFQVHGVDAQDNIVVARQLRRARLLGFFGKLGPCLVGMEACATAHYWAREIAKLGHDVRLMPPGYVKPYVKRGKNDAADAAAICEAVTRPSMRFVPVKNAEQQGALMMHRTRDLLIGQRTQLINALRAHMAELGLVAAKGREGVGKLMAIVSDDSNQRLPVLARVAVQTIIGQLAALQHQITVIERRIHAEHRLSEASRRLAAIPGIGVITASALIGTMTDPKVFRSGREFAAWVGLVPRQNSTGGKERLGGISKQGDRYLRRLLVVGALAVLKQARARPDKYPWLTQLLARRPAKLVAVALANKMARTAWVLLARGESYRPPVLPAAA